MMFMVGVQVEHEQDVKQGQIEESSIVHTSINDRLHLSEGVTTSSSLTSGKLPRATCKPLVPATVKTKDCHKGNAINVDSSVNSAILRLSKVMSMLKPQMSISFPSDSIHK